MCRPLPAIRRRTTNDFGDGAEGCVAFYIDTVSNGTESEEITLMRGAGETLFQGSTSFRPAAGTTSTVAGTTNPARTDIRQGAFSKTATVA